MKREEKDFIQTLPEKYRPKGSWALFWYGILYAIPILGWIFLIVHAISGANICRRSFARRYFCGFILAAIVLGVMAILMFLVFPQFGGMIMEQLSGIFGMIMEMLPVGK